MNGFCIPIVLITFKRYETVLRIIDVLRIIKPSKVYILSDEGRNDEEIELVHTARRKIEEAIDWECNIIKKYSDKNIGVYQNIGEGARWIFQREEQAIFLEDDNLPEATFFQFCSEMLERYKDDDRILWICGTNYLKFPDTEYSYFFSQHMLPCGWASWSDKFLKYYDGMLTSYSKDCERLIKDTYKDKRLFRQQWHNIERTKFLIDKDIKQASWDYQMLFSLRKNKMYGIVPVYNQIRNIGVDNLSEHGGTSLNMVMTNRFCEIPTYEIQFPLKHPLLYQTPYEKEIGDVILMPFKLRLKQSAGKLIKAVLRIDQRESLTAKIKEIRKNEIDSNTK